MGVVTKAQLSALSPWLESEKPNEAGEIGMYCPIHDDKKRSASLNVKKGVWYCNACERGWPVKELIRYIKTHDLENDRRESESNKSNTAAKEEILSDAKVAGWTSALLNSGKVLDEFNDKRGLDPDTIKDFEIGWDSGAKAYTIPVRSSDGELLNIRRYTLHPVGERRKIWSVAGHGTPVLYPIDLAPTWSERVVICEGELDALYTIQAGFDCVTRTGAAKVWKNEWNHYFIDKEVYVCHDMDETGQTANRHVAASLSSVAAAVYIVRLPYEVQAKHGKDLTDYWNDGHTFDDFEDLLLSAEKWGESDEVEEVKIEDVAVLDSFDPVRVGQHLRMRVTITGKRQPNFLAPKFIEYTCDMQAGPKCVGCPMNEEGLVGEHTLELSVQDPMMLQFISSSNEQVKKLLREVIGAHKCNKLEIDVQKYHSLEELRVRPAVDRQDLTQRADSVNRTVIAVNRYDTMPNNTVEITGSILPNPRAQHNEFQAWDIEQTETNVDSFELTSESKAHLKKFQTTRTMRPLKKMVTIARDLSANVTNIHGRNVLHVFMDIVLHSVIAFPFAGGIEPRGWVEGLVVGDTRTGKSRVAELLMYHYGSGEMVSCESASFAGVVGGLQQTGGKEWFITWGAIPLNDRRAVVLDEISGLTHEHIAQMSSIRSSGEAQLTKIQSEKTLARTRLLWMGNPRNGKMSDYTYGVQAIKPLIGNNEDIARFDMAMSLAETDVPSEVINQLEEEVVDHKYTAEACRTLLNWVWSRKAEDVVWEEGAEKAVFDAALEMGRVYTQEPPLVQAANVRLKIARIAVALAARTCSTDESFEQLIVKKIHVSDAVSFLNMIYGSPGFGYLELSNEATADAKSAVSQVDDALKYLKERPGLSKFLRNMSGHFRRMDLEDMLNLSREEANAMVSSLYAMRMLRREGPNIKLNPELHKLLREVKE